MGVTRQIDPLGRLVIPKEIRHNLDLETGTEMEFETEGETIKIRKYSPCCSSCAQNEVTVEIENVRLCRKCAQVVSLLAR